MDYESCQCADDLDINILPGTRQEIKYIYQEVFESLDYTTAGIRLDSDSTVLDIGANIGMFSLYLLKHYPHIHLLAVEPVQQVYAAMATNLAKYQRGKQQVTTVHAGLGAKVGEATITYYPGIPANSTFVPEQKQQEFEQMNRLINAQTVARYNKALVPVYYGLYPLIALLKPLIKRIMMTRLQNEEQQRCRITTVSELLREHQLTQVDLLKVDAEGLEYDILRGIVDEDWPRISQLAIETSNLMAADNTQKIEALLKSRGYQVSVVPVTKGGELAMIYAL